MGIVRNGIEIEGITSENELPSEISGQLIEVSESENLLISKNIGSIQKIFVDTEVKGTRIITSSLSRIFVTDGNKRLKISCLNMENNMEILELTSPFNLFFDVANSKTEVEEMRLYIADAYFELVSSNVLYCNIIYMADIRYFRAAQKDKQEITMNEGELSIPKEAANLEMSISKDVITDLENKTSSEPASKNSLVDIEAEYI